MELILQNKLEHTKKKSGIARENEKLVDKCAVRSGLQ
jgi:hypothetical protein